MILLIISLLKFPCLAYISCGSTIMVGRVRRRVVFTKVLASLQVKCSFSWFVNFLFILQVNFWIQSSNVWVYGLWNWINILTFRFCSITSTGLLYYRSFTLPLFYWLCYYRVGVLIEVLAAALEMIPIGMGRAGCLSRDGIYVLHSSMYVYVFWSLVMYVIDWCLFIHFWLWVYVHST